MQEADNVDRFREQWARELPDVDTRGMAVLGRARRVTLRSRPAIESVFAKHGLDAGEFDVLATLRRSGPPYRLRPTELYRSLMISSGGLTARLNKLQSAGLVSRPAAADDRRSLLVELTAEGSALVERAFREDMRLETRMISGLSEEEQRVLATLLRKLEATMSDGSPADGGRG
jgi:DNA-binding MarR family transcriptional regulator